MRNLTKAAGLFAIAFILCTILQSCGDPRTGETTRSASGVQKATAKVQTDANGYTVEQKNILEKIKRDNEQGAIRYLYQISSYTGDVLEFHTIKGKITSGGKRLNPSAADGEGTGSNGYDRGFEFNVGNYSYNTLEVLGDDGVYGQSMPYFYFFDSNDNYHQIFPTGGTYVHISDRPLRIKKASFIFSSSYDRNEEAVKADTTSRK